MYTVIVDQSNLFISILIQIIINLIILKNFIQNQKHISLKNTAKNDKSINYYFLNILYIYIYIHKYKYIYIYTLTYSLYSNAIFKVERLHKGEVDSEYAVHCYVRRVSCRDRK